MEIHVVNTIVEKWKAYNKVLEPWKLLELRRLQLGRRMGLREYDINQHLINTLRDHGNEEQYASVKNTIVEIVQMIDPTDKQLLCYLYHSLYEELKSVKEKRYGDLTFVKVSDDCADMEKELQIANERADALVAELRTQVKYIERLKKRSWWQRLWNKDVEMYEALNSECKCPNRVK